MSRVAVQMLLCGLTISLAGGCALSRSVGTSGEQNTMVIYLDPGYPESKEVPIELVKIPAGSFIMGSEHDQRWSSDNEYPAHKVTITNDFWMAKTELTQKQWITLMGEWEGFGPQYDFGFGDDVANNYMSWDESQNFIKKLNTHVEITGQGEGKFRLPTEAEWEYACRAGTQTRFYFGDSVNDPTIGRASDDPNDLGHYSWYLGNNGIRQGDEDYGAKPVGQLKPNAFGLYDMMGNVSEFCQDSYHPSFEGAPTDGSVWEGDGAKRVIKGGSWFDPALRSRPAYRNSIRPNSELSILGLRLCRSQ